MIRDLTKSAVSFSLGMTIFGIQQVANIFTPQSPSQPTHSATLAFNHMAKSAEEKLGETLKGAFRASDTLQRGLIEITFGFMTLEGFNPSQLLKTLSNITKQSADALRKSP